MPTMKSTFDAYAATLGFGSPPRAFTCNPLKRATLPSCPERGLMKPGHESQTAIIVCAARALAHAKTAAPRFEDPTALTLLPEPLRRRVERLRSGAKPGSLREGFENATIQRRANMMVARTVAIDDAVRAAAHSQVVILGAGLDGRAWRMGELSDAVVFEVDHPDSQRAKRARLGGLVQRAREVRFVGVDFERDDLDAALASAGHDATRPTTWIWEGVVMYLTLADIHATLAIIARRSAAASEVVIAYHAPAPHLFLVGLVVKRLGEPFRSTFTADAMARTLRAHQLDVTSDEGFPAIGARLSADVAKATRHMSHGRIVVAVRRAQASA